jgi:hypothetical protein
MISYFDFIQELSLNFCQFVKAIAFEVTMGTINWLIYGTATIASLFLQLFSILFGSIKFSFLACPTYFLIFFHIREVWTLNRTYGLILLVLYKLIFPLYFGLFIDLTKYLVKVWIGLLVQRCIWENLLWVDVMWVNE